MKKLIQLFANDPQPPLLEVMGPVAELFISPDPPPFTPEPQRPVSCAKVFHEDLVYFCQRNLALREALSHFLIVGTTKAGKTAGVIKPILKSISPRFRPGRSRPERLVVGDVKGDIGPFLESLGFDPEDKHVWLLNPFDRRGVRWKISEAVQQPALAWHLACIIVPEEPNVTAPFFPDGARLLVFAAILGLNAKCGTNWSFRDLLCALDSRGHIEAVAYHDKEGYAVAQCILKDRKHSPGVISSLATKIRKFSRVAALWEKNPSGRELTIPEFLSSSGVLILGQDPVLKDSLNPLNCLFLRALTDEILLSDETFEPTTWFVFDEYLSTGRADTKDQTILDLLEKGRSKGVSVTLGIQSIAGMIDLYGEAKANSILGLCGHKMFLRLGDPQSAEWAERYFGKIRHATSSWSESWSRNGYSHSVHTSVQDHPLLLSSVFQDIPFPALGRKLHAICDVPSIGGVSLASRSFSEIQSWFPEVRQNRRMFRMTNVKDQTLLPWSKEEAKRFCRPGKRKAGTKIPESIPQKPYLPPRKKPIDPRQGWLF